MMVLLQDGCGAWFGVVTGDRRRDGRGRGWLDGRGAMQHRLSDRGRRRRLSQVEDQIGAARDGERGARRSCKIANSLRNGCGSFVILPKVHVVSFLSKRRHFSMGRRVSQRRDNVTTTEPMDMSILQQERPPRGGRLPSASQVFQGLPRRAGRWP